MDVSIVIIAHKESPYLEKSIESAKNQKFDGNYEIILASDGNSELEKLSKKHNIKFAFNNKKNNLKSWSSNINNAIKYCSGKYIKILHYDDWLTEDCISVLFKSISNTDYSLIHSNAYDYWSENNIKVYKILDTEINYKNILVKNNIHVGTIMFKKQDFIDYGGFDEALEYAEEYEFYLKLLFNNKRFKFIENKVLFYRRHQEQKGTLSLSENEKVKKQNVVKNIQEKYKNKKPIICGISTIIERKEGLEKTINSLLPQVDKIIVYQNGYKEIFNFLKNQKIEVISSIDTKIDKGDAGKFFKIKHYENSYYFSVDDDLIYPHNYVSNTIENLQKYKNEIIITYHGRILKKDAKSYYNDYLKVFHYGVNQIKDEFVHFGGTGVMAFYTGHFKFKFEDFLLPNMTDIWIGKFAQKNKIPILCLKHNKNWIKDFNSTNQSIFTKYSKTDLGQNKLIEDFDKNHVINYIISNEKNKNFLLSVVIPTFKNTKYINESLDSIHKSCKGLNVEILVGIDNCYETLQFISSKKYNNNVKFFFFEKNVGPYVVKNSLSKITNSDLILFFDSDDIMDEKMITNILSLHKVYNMVKPKYLDFKGDVKEKKPHFGEGVFSIKKEIFMSLNGFEPWRCAADSDLMGRLYKSNIKFAYSGEILFYRRIHKDSLTQKPETNYGSKLRKEYVRISKSKKGQIKLPNLVTEKFYEVHPNSIIPFNLKIEKVEIPVPVIIPSPIEKLKGILRGDKPKGVDYEKINDTLKQQGIYNPNKIKEKPKIKQNNPIDRNKLIEIKKGSVTDSLRTNLPNKPNRRKDVPNIFSKKNKK